MDSLKTFSCEICEKTFSSNQTKDKHISIVHGEIKNFQCIVCSKYFSQNQELTIHIETNHKGQRNYKCDSCGKSGTSDLHGPEDFQRIFFFQGAFFKV